MCRCGTWGHSSLIHPNRRHMAHVIINIFKLNKKIHNAMATTHTSGIFIAGSVPACCSHTCEDGASSVNASIIILPPQPSGRPSWTKDVRQMSKGLECKMFFLLYDSHGQEDIRHAAIPNGPTGNSTSRHSQDSWRKKSRQAMIEFLRKSASNPFTRVY